MIYDTTTKNLSFLEVSKVLRLKGINNNKFMLALYDSSLVGVDPFSANLTMEQQVKIFNEIIRNPWYYLREVVRIPQPNVTGGSRYGLNLGNLAISFCKWKSINFIAILMRQAGKTIGTIAYDTWLMNFGAENSTFVYLNKQSDNALENLRRYKDIRELLPKWLLAIVGSDSDTDNMESKRTAKLNNVMVCKASASSDEMADKIGRGLTVPFLYLDEIAFMAHNKTIWGAAVPAWSKAAEIAKSTGGPRGISITTTPGNIYKGSTGEYVKNTIIGSSARFDERMYDMTDAELEDYIKKTSSNDIVYIEYDYKALGYSETWIQAKARELNDTFILKRDFLLEWPKTDVNNVFSEDQLDRIYHYVKQPKLHLNVSGYGIEFYEDPDLSMNYILSCDVSGGLSQDNSVISIISPIDFHMVGCFKNSRIDTEEFKNLIKTLMKLFFNHAILVVEKNSYGLNILDALIKDPELEPRIYRETKDKQAEKTQVSGLTVKRKTKTIVYGVDTTKESRAAMYDLLGGIVADEYDKIVSPWLYDDIKNLARGRNGKIEAATGEHDDVLMSYLIFRYALQYGQNFQKLYHISAIATEANARGAGSADSRAMVKTIIQNENVMAGGSLGGYWSQAIVEDQHKINSDLAASKKGPDKSSDDSSFFRSICDMNGNDDNN
jgi:hypothetical protein